MHVSIIILLALNAAAEYAPLLPRQDRCGASSAYFNKCYGCCSTNTPGGAGCYAPLTIIGQITYTGLFGCYTTPPGRVVDVVSATATTTNAASPTGASTCPDGLKCDAGKYCSLLEGEWGCCPNGKVCDTWLPCEAGYKGCGSDHSCILESSTCCPGGKVACKAGAKCYTASSGEQDCCRPGVNCPGDSLSATARSTAVANVVDVVDSTSLAALQTTIAQTNPLRTSSQAIPPLTNTAAVTQSTSRLVGVSQPTGAAGSSYQVIGGHWHWLLMWMMPMLM